jgi:pimeloyl-ACP methyl ester carboxylesterase
LENILYIHGAGASKRSFNWLVDNLIDHKPYFFSYELSSDISESIELLEKQIKEIGKPLTIIGHSLGGLLAAGVCDNPLVKQIITISAPLGGILAVGLFGLMNSQAMFRDLLPYSSILYEIKCKNQKSNKMHYAIVSTHGLPIVKEPNDGVVMVSSQMAWTTPKYQKYNLNHFEILMDNEVLEDIKKILSD